MHDYVERVDQPRPKPDMKSSIREDIAAAGPMAIANNAGILAANFVNALRPGIRIIIESDFDVTREREANP